MCRCHVNVLGRTALWVVAMGTIGALVGCDDDTVLVSPVPSQNEAPRIVAWGPEPPLALVNLRPFDTGPDLHVVVADPNGLNDVAAVYLEYDSLSVNRLIARRSLQEEGCREVVYANMDTLALSEVLPTVLPGVGFISLSNSGSGLFVSPQFCTPYRGFLTPAPECPLFPQLENLSAEYGFPGCIDGTEWLWVFVLFPPLVPNQTTVFITEADVTYSGLRVVAFDTGGLSDTTSFGDLRIVHTTDTERRVAP
jgi:hypothetical protein